MCILFMSLGFSSISAEVYVAHFVEVPFVDVIDTDEFLWSPLLMLLSVLFLMFCLI